MAQVSHAGTLLQFMGAYLCELANLLIHINNRKLANSDPKQPSIVHQCLIIFCEKEVFGVQQLAQGHLNIQMQKLGTEHPTY